MINVSGMEQFGTELWCRHQLATVLWSVTDVRDDEDPFESCAAEIELASSRATSAPCQIAECNGISPGIYHLVLKDALYITNDLSENRPIGLRQVHLGERPDTG
ncbi:hypothetical protein FC17_GL001308 [Secundilactobacillus paracollinoides DSM 15502 = JCM 11969]|nr:hypothetical protein FC17_GL001308 [Secundilactobacillus paracollinoides DSM 15502 = JCM 11969]